jgi:ATP-binding cassette, subfamily B, bacterial PglK
MLEYLNKILYLLGEKRNKISFMIVLFIVISILEIASLALIGPYVSIIINPELIKDILGDLIYDIGLPSDTKLLIIVIGLVLLAIFILKIITTIWVNLVIIRFSQNQQVYLRSYLMQVYQSMPYTNFISRNSSEYIYNIQSLTSKYSTSVLMVLNIVSNSIIGFFIIGFLAWRNPYVLFLLITLLGTVMLTYDKFFRHRLISYGKHSNKASTLLIKSINEGMSGLKEIRIFGSESYFFERVKRSAKDYSIYQIKSQMHTLIPRYLMELVIIVFVVSFVTGELLLGHNLDTLAPTLGVFGFASMRLLPIMSIVTSGMNQLHESRDGISRLHKDYIELERLKPLSFEKNSYIATNPFCNITFDLVSFSYPDVTNRALDQISLEIRAGESIGLIGPSGSGKTTLVDVLLGLLTPQTGLIKYNDKLLSSALDEWRSQIAYLPQQVFLMDDTLSNNITFGKNIDESRLHESIEQARLTDFVTQLPEGLDTIIGEKGIRISGGQRQRVAIARAFYHNTSVLIMDESTSALDSETEREITDEIKLLKGRKTLVIIAHRLSTVQNCDRIYRIDKGRIVDVGLLDNDLNFIATSD